MKRQTFRSGVSQRLRANAFKREGGVFVGWAKSRNGAIAYKNRQMVKNIKAGGGKLTLYARWAKSTYKVRFKPNGGKGTMKVESFQYGKAKALFKNRFTRKGYVFAGWAARPKGKVKFSDGKKVKNLTKTGYTIYLYAVWKKPSYTVRYNANGGRGTMANQTLEVNRGYTLRANAFTRTGYTFAGWAKSAGGSVAYGNGANVRNLAKKGATVTLYAVWRANTYKVRFNANGGRGTMSDQSFTYNAAQSLRANAFTRDGHTFVGWAKSASGAKVYSNRQNVSNLATANGAVVTLYAVWTRNTTPPAPAANGLIVRYYDISSSGYSTWTQSEAAMTNYFANYTPAIVTNTLDWGETLDAGYSSLPGSDVQSSWRSGGLTVPPQQCLFHGKYANASTRGFAALMSGYLRIHDLGTYRFAGVADDTVVLYIDGHLILANNEEWLRMATGETVLSAGYHRIIIAYREQDTNGGQGLSVQWKKPGDSSYAPIPQSVLSRTDAGGNTLSDGLVAWYSFDGNANDSSGNGNHGTVNGPTLTTDRNGRANRAYSFDGNDTIVAAGSESLNSITEEFTIATWVRVDSLSSPGYNWAPVLCKGDRHYSLNLNFSSKEDTEISYNCWANFQSLPRLGEWAHLAVTLDGNHVSKAYLNGVCVGSRQNGASIRKNTSNLVIGSDPPGSTEYLHGALDDLAIWRRALTAEEVARLYKGATPLTESMYHADWFVNASSGNDTFSGRSWGTAKRTIQAAIDAASAGDTILVADGTYGPIATDNKTITIRSVNGAGKAIIDGKSSSCCAWLTYKDVRTSGDDHQDTVLQGFTLQDGRSTGAGGVYGGTVRNCIIRNCRCDQSNKLGGGARLSMLYNCLVVDCYYNGVVHSKTYNCTIVNNGNYGCWDGYAYNCIVYGHKDNFPCMSASDRHPNCVTDDPGFVDADHGDYRLSSSSQCINAGNNAYVTTDTDLAGNTRIAGGTVDIGAYEYTTSR